MSISTQYRNRKILEKINKQNFSDYIGQNPEISYDVNFEQLYKDNLKKEKDLSIKRQQKQFQRKSFSPIVNSFEGDLMFVDDEIYLVLINVNTRFAYIREIPDKSIQSILWGLANLIYYGLKINSLKFDGESALNSYLIRDFAKQNNFKIYSSNESYLNRVKIVDRFIRTLRDNLFKVEDIIDKRYGYDIVLQELVSIYNNTFHSAINMKPSEMTYDKEYKYIEEMKTFNNAQKYKQQKSGLYNFKPGDKIKIYLKTNSVFEKRRGNYIHDAVFMEYKHGNAVVNYNGSNIEIPIYWLKI